MTGRRFELRPEHIVLLRAANMHWNGIEFGAPTIDPKRPYGNSDAEKDIAALLGFPKDGDGNPYGDWVEAAIRIHAETSTALEVVLRTGSFEPGVYVTTSPYESDWLRLGPLPD